jgi:hypothetical protein
MPPAGREIKPRGGVPTIVLVLVLVLSEAEPSGPRLPGRSLQAKAGSRVADFFENEDENEDEDD